MSDCPRYCEIFGPGACAGVFDEKECVINAPQTAMETLRLELPIPPLVNHYWRHITIKGAPRTLISARGRDFRENVMQIVGRGKKALKDAGFTVRMEGSRAMSEAERADVAGARYA